MTDKVEHPKAMHKGGEVLKAFSPEEEADLRNRGWIDGHEYCSKKAIDVAASLGAEAETDELEVVTLEPEPKPAKKPAKHK
jgi:hypothetical protein